MNLRMSANNFILVNRKTFEVTMRNADTGTVLIKIGKTKTLDEAVDLAENYLEKEIVEYGIRFTKK